jgi:flagellar basal-body rod modification protein FlgD
MTTTNPLNNSTVNTQYAVGTVVNADGTTQSPDANGTNTVSQDDFLQLLVAELKNQSPDSPADTSQMMSQEAQFSELNAVMAMSKSITSMLNSQQSAQAASMIGKSITATNPNGGDPITGVVTGTKLGTDGPTLLIGNKEVALDTVEGVDTPTTTNS